MLALMFSMLGSIMAGLISGGVPSLVVSVQKRFDGVDEADGEDFLRAKITGVIINNLFLKLN